VVLDLRKRLKTAMHVLLGMRNAKERNQRLHEMAVLSTVDREIVARTQPYTMTGIPRTLALLDAVEYLVRRDISGAFVECGVWRGGSVLAMVLKLQSLGISDRDIYLYDTFEGMTEPTVEDTSPFEMSAVKTWAKAKKLGKRGWDQLFDPKIFNEEQVRDLLLGTGYPKNRLHFVKGPVEKTIPLHAPERIALLRLDTDWYESTRHELIQLYPRLVSGGILIIDDYGHWEGCRRAVDEYFAENSGQAPFLSRIDYTGRIAVRQ
jgi:O-methyltransferase